MMAHHNDIFFWATWIVRPSLYSYRLHSPFIQLHHRIVFVQLIQITSKWIACWIKWTEYIVYFTLYIRTLFMQLDFFYLFFFYFKPSVFIVIYSKYFIILYYFCSLFRSHLDESSSFLSIKCLPFFCQRNLIRSEYVPLHKTKSPITQCMNGTAKNNSKLISVHNRQWQNQAKYYKQNIRETMIFHYYSYQFSVIFVFCLLYAVCCIWNLVSKSIQQTAFSPSYSIFS